MSARRSKGIRLVALAALFAQSLSSYALCGEKSMKALLEAAGVEPGPGLCAHLWCGDGRLTTALARDGGFLVRGLSADKAQIDTSRQRIHAEGIYGKASVGFCAFKELPFTENTVNLLVAEDLGALLSKGVTIREVIRVMAPLGTGLLGAGQLAEKEFKDRLAAAGLREAREGEDGYTLVRHDGLWARLKKGWPKGMDEWNHSMHNKADRNPVSRDTHVGVPSGIRWLSYPKWLQTGGEGQIKASARGRIFYLAGLGEPGVAYDKNPMYLIARDAFNGLLLWKRRYPAGDEAKRGRSAGIVLPTTNAFLAVQDWVFVMLEKGTPLQRLDARTGETQLIYKDAGVPNHVLYHSGSLIISVDGSVRSIDPMTGAKRWEVSLRAGGLTAAEGKVFFFSYPKHTKAKPKPRAFICLDAATGKEIWQAPLADLGSFRFHYKGVLFFRKRVKTGKYDAGIQTSAVSATDGRLLWKFSGERMNAGGRRLRTQVIFGAQGLCWNIMSNGDKLKGYYVGLDPLTGEKKAHETVWSSGRCFPGMLTENWAIISDLNCLKFGEGEFHCASFSRPACGSGGMVANGLIYPWTNGCMCYVQSRGMMAMAPERSDRAKRKPLDLVDRFVKGPAYEIVASHSSTKASAKAEEEWPTYRHDGKRSGASKTKVAADAGMLWSKKLGGKLSAPVIARGKVFVASVDSHQVHALDEKGGRPVWTYNTSGRVMLPPTVHEELCIFSSLDGWVTCLKADTGELAWRFQAAPESRLIGAYGQLESPWPVYGVLVHDGAIYCVAGRNADADGGVYIYSLDPRNGSLIWQQHYRTKAVSCKRESKTGKFLWIQPRLPIGTGAPSSTSSANAQTGVTPLIQEYFYLEGGAYKTDPMTGRIHWLTDAELKASPEKVAWKTFEPTAENFKSISSHSSRWRMPTKSRSVDLLEVDLPVANKDRFFIKARGFAYKDGATSYVKRGDGLRPNPNGGRLLESFNAWRCYSWMRHKQYYGDGRPIVYDDSRVYASRHDQLYGATMDVVGRGVRLYAWGREAHEPVMRKVELSKLVRKSKKVVRDFVWDMRVPIRALSMAATKEVLFVAGISDEGLTKDLPPDEFWGRIRGRDGGVLYAIDKADGKVLAKQRLAKMPVFDGMAAANGRLYVSCEDGELMCFGVSGELADRNRTSDEKAKTPK